MGRIIKILKKHKLKITLITLILLGSFFGYKYFFKKDTTPEVRKNVIVKVKKGSISSGVETSGAVETANFLPITTSVNGIVKEVFVKEGDTVTKGQKIMQITLNADGEEALTQAWGSYLSAKNSLDRTKTELLSKEIAKINAEEAFQDEKERNSYQSHDERISYRIAENTYNAAKESYDQQLSSIDQAKVALNKAWLSYQAQSPSIVAPDNGVVANILVVEGMDITNSLSERTSTSVASIKKEGNPIVSLNITELDINRIKVSQKANIELDSIENKTFSGEVVGIDRIGAVSSGITNYTVIVRFDESSDLVLPNMSVDGKIILEEKNDVLIIPSSAVISQRKQTYVNKIENGEEKRIEVVIGISDGDYTEITKGLNEGDEVAVTSLPTTGFSEATEQNRTGEFRGPGMMLR